MSSAGAAPRAAVSVSDARAAASRRNGARSRGPKTAEGKARSAQNALKHGLRAEKYVVLADEDPDEFGALEAALEDELAPEGALQRFLARRVACAAWRLMRAERLEVELFEERRAHQGGLGLALIRDGNGSRSFETLLRYRGAAQAELWRALRTLKALQAEQLAPLAAAAPGRAATPLLQRTGGHAGAASSRAGEVASRESPIEPEPGRIAGASGPRPGTDGPEQPSGPAGTRTDEPQPAIRAPASAGTARAPAERTPAWVDPAPSGACVGNARNSPRGDRTAPGAWGSGGAAGAQLARSTP